MGVVSNSIFTRRKGVELLCDKVFAGNNPIFIRSPRAVLMKPLRGGTLAKGWISRWARVATQFVTGFDPSSEGVRIARSNADKIGVRIRALVARDDEFQYGENQWFLIVMTYVRDLTTEDAQRFSKALRPGGIVVYENGADESNSVLRAFLGYEIVRFEDVPTNPERNPDNCIRVQRLIAQKTLK